MDTEGQALGPYEPVSDELVLAAIERAIRQGPDTVWIIHVAEHLGFRRQTHTTRKVREQLERIRVQDGTVERLDRMGREYWRLSPAGERHLAEARNSDQVGVLPESPQHRSWRTARAAAAERIDRFRALLSAAIQEAHTAELEVTAPPSATWLALSERLAAAAWLVGSATYCLDEWAEPSDELMDVDTSDPTQGSTPRRRAVVRWDEIEAIAKGTQP